MQAFKLLYSNECHIYIADGGWCLLTYDNTPPKKSILEEKSCLLFFPEEFIPDKSFCSKAEQYCARISAKLVWVENPSDSYTFWKCTVSADNSSLSVGIGGCTVGLNKLRNEEDSRLVFDGVFNSFLNLHSFQIADAGIVVNLEKSTGELSFKFYCDKNTDLFTAMNAGIKYVMPLSCDIEKGYERNYTSSFYNSVFFSDSQLALDAVITPCVLQSCDSTYISLPNNTLKSSFLTNIGCPIELKPLNAKLVLESTATAVSYDESTETYSFGGLYWYWGIAGDFMLANKSVSGGTLMLGLSSTEYIESIETIELKFIPHQNALINDNCNTENKNDGNLSAVTAPWVSFKGEYHSFSDSMPLFTVQSNQSLISGNENDYMRAYIPVVSQFSDFSHAVPFMPWRNASTFDSHEAIIAENSLYKNRFNTLTGIMCQSEKGHVSDHVADNSITAITPCGLCANINPVTHNWNWLGIAQTSHENLPNVRLCALNSHTRSMLQNKDCVLTVSTIEEFKALGTEETSINLPVDGWKIVLSEQYWDKDKTLFLMKYSTSSTTRENLVGTPQLDNILSLAYTGNGQLKPEYEEFMDIIDDTDFQGILILGATALPKNVPAEVKAVTSDIESGDIKAAYTVIYKSRTDVTDDGKISVSKSNISSVFSYKCESIKNDSHKDVKLDFRTVGLIVVLKQSSVKEFSCRSELLIAELFGSVITPSNLEGGSCLILNGILEKIGGTAVYRFSLANPLQFSSPNTPINKIVFNDLRMISTKDETDFVLAGKLSFAEIDGFDVFSYELLPFSGVKIVKKGSKLTADYTLSAISQETVLPRMHSFSEAFGAKISDVIFCESDKTPDDIAFSSIMSPVKQGTLDKTWNGIVWTVSLGSSGELGNSKEISFEIITAWSNNNYYIGLRLPGVLNKNFSIQSLFTASFSGIDLQKSHDNVLYFKLHGFTLKLLGISVPKNGAELLIFGEHGKIAWYMGYDNQEGEP